MNTMSSSTTTATTSTMRFAPLNLGRWLVWSVFVVLLVVAPLIFNKGAALSILCQMGTVMIFGLSYNMLLGQGGMLSFGHAVYSGLGAFFAIHTMNQAATGIHVPDDVVEALVRVLDKVPEGAPPYRLLNVGRGAPVSMARRIAEDNAGFI